METLIPILIIAGILGMSGLLIGMIHIGVITFDPQFPMAKREDGTYPQVTDAKNRVLCPNCGSTHWNSGPEGGGSTNIQCNECLEYYNYMGPFGLQPIGPQSWGKSKPEEQYEDQI